MPKAAGRSNSRERLVSKKWKCEPTWIGRSPVLRTFRVTVGRPALISMSPFGQDQAPDRGRSWSVAWVGPMCLPVSRSIRP